MASNLRLPTAPASEEEDFFPSLEGGYVPPQRRVTERTREIGLRQAVGASTRDILLLFLVEAVAISLLGGTAPIACGVVVSILISRIAHWSTIVSAGSIALAFVFSGFVGVFLGYYPARKAALLNPIDALRYE